MFSVWLYVNISPFVNDPNDTSVNEFNDDADTGSVCGIHRLLTLSYVKTYAFAGGLVETSTSVRESSDKIEIWLNNVAISLWFIPISTVFVATALFNDVISV